MARPKGSKNRPKQDEILFTHACKDCGFVLKTCIPNVQIGHVCNGKAK